MFQVIMLTMALPAQADPFVDTAAYAIRRVPKEGVITSPHDAARLARDDAKALESARYSRYVWVPDWIEPASGFAQVSFVMNSTLSRTSNIVRPVSLADGRLVRIDLTKYVARPGQLDEITALYEKLAERESYFSVRVKQHPPADPLVTSTAAKHTCPEGQELFDLTGSSVPIMRLDEWVAYAFSTINGGLYYQFVGTKPTLGETIKEFAGADAASKVTRISASMRKASAEGEETGEHVLRIAGRLDPELAKSKALILTSGVTGRQRLAAFFFGAGTPPTSGVQLVAVTFDIAEDNTDPASDPLRNAAVFETYNGGEAILAMPNGLLMYLVFDAQDRIIASVPDNVAHDHRARNVRSNVATTRVFSGVSCANCHEHGERNWGWQPVVNDLAESVKGLTKILDDRGQRSGLEAMQVLTSQYGADTIDLRAMLDQARIPYQYRAQLATDQRTTRETVAGLADSYWGYWYDAVTAQVAARDLGHAMNDEEAQLFLLRAIEPEPVDVAQNLLVEDAVVARLKDGKHVTPAQWRTVFSTVAERLLLTKPEPMEAIAP